MEYGDTKKSQPILVWLLEFVVFDLE